MRGATKALIVGGGIGGMATAMRLRQEGVDVDLIDVDPRWSVYGAGITITGPTLRAYGRLGLRDQIKTQGAITNGVRMFHFSGAHIADMDEPELEDGIAETGGILRPVLHDIMSKEVRKSGANVRLGVTVERIDQDEGGVDVVFSDGAKGRYDLLVAADGIYSKVRSMLWPDAVAPRFTGQVSYRILADRPPGFDRGEFYLGHRNAVGITACSPSQVYVFMLHADAERTRLDVKEGPDKVRELLKDFGGNIAPIRDKVSASSSIVYRPFEAALQPRPWNRGRVVLIGDAAHATTAHLASGGGLAVEDALVLTEELKRNPDVAAALAAFTERRFERCRYVVETSLAIGEVQMAGRHQEVGPLMGRALHYLQQDI